MPERSTRGDSSAELSDIKEKISELVQYIDRKAEKQELMTLQLDFEKYIEITRTLEGEILKVKSLNDEIDVRNTQLSREVNFLRGLIDTKADKTSVDIIRQNTAKDKRPTSDLNEVLNNMKAREARLQTIEDMFNKASYPDLESRTLSYKRSLGSSSYQSSRPKLGIADTEYAYQKAGESARGTAVNQQN